MRENTPHEIARRNVYNMLLNRKMRATRMAYKHPFDLLVGGRVRLDIKTAAGVQKSPYSKVLVWNFVIHYKGKTKRDHTDFYVLHIPPIKALGMGSGLYLVVPAADVRGKKNIWISGRTLLLHWVKYAEQWEQIRKFKS